MADLNELQSSGSTKIVGSDSTGNENTPVNATTSGSLYNSLRDASGSAITTLVNHGDIYLKQATIQDRLLSILNSSIVNLAANAVSPGSSESLAGCSTIFVTVRADQPLLVKVQQSPDGTNWDVEDSYTVSASTTDSRGITAQAAFVRILVTNSGASTTTFFRLQTILSSATSALPRALDQFGNFKVSVQNVAATSDKNGTGSIAALNATVTSDTTGCGSISFTITGTWVATLIFEGTADGVTWFTIQGMITPIGDIVSTITSNTSVILPCGGFSKVRVRSSLFTSGSATIAYDAGSGGNIDLARLADSRGNNIDSQNRQLKTVDIMDGGGLEGAITVGTTATPARVGASNLLNRKNLTIYNNGTVAIFWGYTAGVTTATGTQLFRNQTLEGDWGPNTTIYLITTIAGQNVRITEGA